MTDTEKMALQEKETTPPQSPTLPREQMLADTDQLLADFALDYKRMSE